MLEVWASGASCVNSRLGRNKQQLPSSGADCTHLVVYAQRQYLQMPVALLACLDDCNVVEDSKLVQV